MEASRLAALVASRVVHDLITPVTGLGAALDAYRSSPAPDQRELAMQLIEQQIDGTRAKLVFLRLALGAAGIGDDPADFDEARRIAEDFFAPDKRTLIWKNEKVDAPRTFMRLMLNLCLIAADTLPRGGGVSVVVGGDAEAIEGVVTSRGPKLNVKPGVFEALRGDEPADGFDGRNVQPYFAGLVARQSGVELMARQSEDRIELIARLPRSRMQSAA